MSIRIGFVGLVLAASSSTLLAQQISIIAGGATASHEVVGGYQRVRLLVTGPDGLVAEQYRNGANANAFQIDAQTLADGQYNYRLDFVVQGAAQAADAALASGTDGRALSVRPGVAAPAPKTGSFVIQGGQVLFPKAPLHDGDQDTPGKAKPPVAKDQVIADDLIVQGSICAGFDCINNESFGFDTIRMKENNTRVKFEDTSTGAFPSVDWQLTANDSASGGQDKFSIEDITNARVPFTVEALAPTNSLYLDSSGRIGFRTTTPVLDLHVSTSNTPAHRLEQTNEGGFTAQTWDVAGNEANFFVRDVTSGSRLPFRIRPGAPTSSIDIAASGDIGVGVASPTARLNVHKAVAVDTPEPMLRLTNPNFGASGGLEPEDHRFEVDSSGNVNARGTISQLSSRAAKEDFASVDGEALLAKIDALPISSWRYIAAPDRHLGPVAEDFHQAFGLGSTDKMIAPSDLAGVALAAVKALQDQVQQRDRQIEALERRLADIEARAVR